MQFDTILDMTYKFRKLELAEIQEFLSFLVKLTHGIHDFMFWHEYEPETNQEGISFSQERMYIAIKRTVDDDRYQIEKYIRKQDLPLMEKKGETLCIVPQCWNEVAANQYKATLFYPSGEEMHPIHDFCEHHVETSDKHILETIQMKDLPDENAWHVDHVQVASWQGQDGWYSERIWNATDGDYESGYYDYTTASPHLGPFESRTLAVIAAQDWESEY